MKGWLPKCCCAQLAVMALRFGALTGFAVSAYLYACTNTSLHPMSCGCSTLKVTLMLLNFALAFAAAHRVAVLGARLGLVPRDREMEDPVLRVLQSFVDGTHSIQTRVFGHTFPNPIGLAAGFDKHAEAIPEIGSVTPLPQPGNAKPRVFRLSEDRAVINRYGFNSEGGNAVAERLASYRSRSKSYWPWQWPEAGVLGVNLGKNKDAAAVPDYTQGVRQLGPYADYLVVNVSSPNTPNLRALQRKSELQALTEAVLSERDALTQRIGKRLPVLVKISPDLSSEELAEVADVALSLKVDGLIVSNTTLQRPASLRDPQAKETGGLSGAPLKDLSTQVLSDMYKLTKGAIPLVGVGGVSSGKDAYDKIKSGASLVQLYSALVYEGPALVPQIKRELASLLRADGYRNVSEAVGAAHKDPNRLASSTPV